MVRPSGRHRRVEVSRQSLTQLSRKSACFASRFPRKRRVNFAVNFARQRERNREGLTAEKFERQIFFQFHPVLSTPQLTREIRVETTKR